jgi:peptidoglycan/xylan/chitin deacetylase (PgdA/CDA1 family)
MSVKGRFPAFGLAMGSLLLWAVSAGCDLFPWLTPPHTGAGPMVNLQVDAENDDVAGLTRITDELMRRGIRTTVYVTADYVNKGHAQLIKDLYNHGFEIALHGYYTGEQLATMTYEEQLDLLTRAKTAVEGCQPCGMYKPVTGFRPQYFSQNEGTYKVLQVLGLTYDSGFKAGLLAIEGHEQDAAPYGVTGDGYSFTAVPITTAPFGDKTLYICDLSCAQGENMTGAQWGELLQTGYAQAKQNNQPFVILIHNYLTGDTTQYDYWQPFISMLDQLEADDANFVTTEALVASTQTATE